MSKGNYLFTSESVSEGHPDKISDQVSDAVLDALLEQDPNSRVAVETLCKTGLIVLAGEVTSKANIDYASIARKVVSEIGYNKSEYGFDAKSCGVMVSVEQQSPDISQGVDIGEGKFTEQGAGDQGMMFGYACNETAELMPATISFSHKLMSNLAQCRRDNVVSYLRPDSKGQVSIEYKNGKMSRVDTVVVSTQHDEETSMSELEQFVVEEVVKKSIPQELLVNTKYLINPTGRFVIGGPQGDCGLTGRKIIVDTYGGHGAHGGGAFSGKDPSKVDRSAAYYGRYIAKNIVAAGLAEKCLVQLSYAIGVAEPVSIFVDSYGTSSKSQTELSSIVKECFKTRPAEIVKQLDLLRPIYLPTAAYGHFGRDGFPWEKLDKVEQLRSM